MDSDRLSLLIRSRPRRFFSCKGKNLQRERIPRFWASPFCETRTTKWEIWRQSRHYYCYSTERFFPTQTLGNLRSFLFLLLLNNFTDEESAIIPILVIPMSMMAIEGLETLSWRFLSIQLPLAVFYLTLLRFSSFAMNRAGGPGQSLLNKVVAIWIYWRASRPLKETNILFRGSGYAFLSSAWSAFFSSKANFATLATDSLTLLLDHKHYHDSVGQGLARLVCETTDAFLDVLEVNALLPTVVCRFIMLLKGILPPL